MATTKTALTWEEFLAAGKPGQRWEYINGEVRFMSPNGGQHGLFIHKIELALGNLDPEERVCFGADVAFTMAGGDLLCPDAAVVRSSRFQNGVVPERKRRIYNRNGVTQVWVDFQAETVEVISPNRPALFFGPGETVTIEELPGFALTLFTLPTRTEG
jgi:Uma2 family endonuclease